MCYRLWSEGKATLTELDTTLSMMDVVLACDYLDSIADAEARYRKLSK